jgi:DNA-binding MarR family transcriptional regulator/GNAT superfamily N-acetyltransferase
MATADSYADPVGAIRAFNRFWTNHMGLLAEGLLDSAFSLTEARVLFELATRDQPTATEIGRELGLDPGYLSRILKSFERQGLIGRTATPGDGRQRALTLTDTGRTAFAPLNEASRRQAGSLIESLGSGVEDMVTAMVTIQRILSEPGESAPVTLRSPQLGDIGRIIQRQARLYEREYGWDVTFEILLAEIFAAMMKHFDPATDRGWIAQRDGDIVGSVYVVRQSDDVAKLRLLYVEPAARGLGLGRRLVRECIEFARAKGYKRLTLWTNDVLKPARRIYQQAGFICVASEQVHQFGQDMASETWDLDLTVAARSGC